MYFDPRDICSGFVPPQAALLQHVFTVVLPVPRADSDDFWHTPMRYALQLDVLLLLKRLMEHFGQPAGHRIL